MKRSEVIQSVISWNNVFPLDRWWRVKHNVAFLSKVHREYSFISQLMEYEEDKLYREVENFSKNKVEYIPGVGEYLTIPQTMESFADEARKEIQNFIKPIEDVNK